MPRPLDGKMVISCCAFGCQNRQRKPNTKFFRFPSNSKQRLRWILAVKRDKWTPDKYSRICSDHFVGGIAGCLRFIILSLML